MLQTYIQTAHADGGEFKRQFDGPLRSVQIEKIVINDQTSLTLQTLSSDDVIRIDLQGQADEIVRDFRFAISIFHEGVRLMTLHDLQRDLPNGPFRVTAEIPARTLRPGTYAVAAGGRRVSGDEWIWGTDLAMFEVIPNWRDDYEYDNKGVFNSIGRITRYDTAEPA